jgi:hypothetical protein
VVGWRNATPLLLQEQREKESGNAASFYEGPAVGGKMERVAWVPGWYELDPQLEVGREGEFVFWRVVPEHLRGPKRLVLYNYLWRPEDGMFASGKIAAIRHPELGDIRKVDTRGLDYTITLVDGTELVVNVEEDVGKMYEGKPGAWVESQRVVSNWRFEVEFECMSELSPESKRRRNR